MPTVSGKGLLLIVLFSASLEVASAGGTLNIGQPDVYRESFPEFHQPVVCKDASNSTVTCKKLYLLYPLWMSCQERECPLHVAWAMRYGFEHMRNLINLNQEILPGYEIVVDFLNTGWDLYETVKLVGQSFANLPTRYCGVVQGPDPAALVLSRMAFQRNLPHFAFHLASTTSQRQLAPAYFRPNPGALDFWPFMVDLCDRLGWRRMATIYSPVQFGFEADMFQQVLGKSNITMAFKLPLSYLNYELDLNYIVIELRRTRVRPLMIFAEHSSVGPLMCRLVIEKIHGLSLFAIPDPPFWVVPQAAWGFPHLMGTCTLDTVASFSVNFVLIRPVFLLMGGFLGKVEQPHTCLPNDPNAGGSFTRWWLTKLIPAIKATHPTENPLPTLIPSDSPCMIALAFRHMLFDKGYSVEDLTGTNSTAFQDLRSFLHTLEFSGNVGPVKITNKDSWAGPDNGDGIPSFELYQVRYGEGMNLVRLTTPNGVWDRFGCGPWNLQNRARNLVGMAESDTFDPCPAGSVREAKFINWAAGFETGCQLCPLGRSNNNVDSLCSDCGAGTYADELGLKRCKLCPAGKHMNTTGASECSPCSEGSATVGQVGQIKCDLCPPGSFAAESGSISCGRCAAGFFSTDAGSSACVQCDANNEFTTTPGATSVDECVCPDNKFLGKDNREKCLPCQEGMTCAAGSDMVNFDQAKLAAFHDTVSKLGFPKLQPRFWSDVHEPLRVFACANSERCPGGNPGTCDSGAEGLSCASCEEDHYGTAEGCFPCSDMESSYALFPLIPLVILPIVIVRLYMQSRKSTPDRWGKLTKCITCLGFLCLAHYQTISLVSAAKTTTLMSNTWKFWAIAGDAGLSLFKLDCAGFGSFQAQYVLKSVLPLVPLAIIGVVFLTSRGAALVKPFLAMDPNNLCDVYGSIIYAFFTGIASMCLSLFKCSTNPNSKQTLTDNLSVLCYESEWSSMLGVAIVASIVYCGGGLAMFSYIMLIAPKSFKNVGFQNRWKFLFIKYRLDVHWWGLVLLAKGVLLNFGAIASTDVHGQVYWVSMTCGAYVVMTIIFSPWRFRIATVFDCAVHMNVIVVVSLTTWFSRRSPDYDKRVSVFTVVGSCLPCLFFVVASAFVIYPVVQNKINPDKQSKKMEKMATTLKKTMQGMGSLEVPAIQDMYKALSQNDQMMMWAASQVINAEIFGEQGVRLSTGRVSELAVNSDTPCVESGDDKKGTSDPDAVKV